MKKDGRRRNGVGGREEGRAGSERELGSDCF